MSKKFSNLPLVFYPTKRGGTTPSTRQGGMTHRPTKVLTFFHLLVIPILISGVNTMLCGVPGRSQNETRMTLYSATVYNPGQKVEYSCQPGLALLGDSVRTCQNDGSWSGSRPRCVDNLAYGKPVASSRVVNHYRPDLLVDDNIGSCIYLDTRVENRFIQIDLGQNYLIKGLILYVPDGYAQQDLTVFIAEKLESTNGIQYRRCTKNLSRINTSKLQIDCRSEGGVPVAIPGRFLHIRDERKVHDFYFALCEIQVFALAETPLSCGVPDQPAFASPINQTRFLEEEKDQNTFELACQTGFILRGQKFLHCIDGNWIGNDGARCMPVECQPLAPLINGQIDLFPMRGLANNSFNTVARHRCLEGYMIFGGDVTRTCGQDKRWTGTPPTCRPTDCQLPRTIKNAAYKLIDNQTKPGAIAQYTCFNGYVPQRILADKPLQTTVVCQRSGLWKEGNFYCALRTTYYLPVSTSFSASTNKSGQLGHETVPSETIISKTTQKNLSLTQEIEYANAQPPGTSFELEESDSSISTSTEPTEESNHSSETALAAIGFVAAFVLMLIVFAGVALNIFRMRTTFDRVRNRFLMISTNLLIKNPAPMSKDCESNTFESEMENRDGVRIAKVKVDQEPVFELNRTTFQPLELANIQLGNATVQEEESAYLDIQCENDSVVKNNSPQYFTETAHQLYNSSENESSFIESRPSLTQEEVLLLYAKVDKTKKTKYRNATQSYALESITKSGTTEISTNDATDNSTHQIQTERQSSSSSIPTSCKITDLHPNKVNKLQLPKTVVEVTLNEYFIEHSRIRCQEKNTTYIVEGRPLPALPDASELIENHHQQEDTDSQHIYATLPGNKS